MSSADTPTQLEKNLSYIISFLLPPVGFILAIVYFVKYSHGFRSLARNCIFTSIASMVIVTLAIILWDFFLR